MPDYERIGSPSKPSMCRLDTRQPQDVKPPVRIMLDKLCHVGFHISHILVEIGIYLNARGNNNKVYFSINLKVLQDCASGMFSTRFDP